jgi:hypothetical protein
VQISQVAAAKLESIANDVSRETAAPNGGVDVAQNLAGRDWNIWRQGGTASNQLCAFASK